MGYIRDGFNPRGAEYGATARAAQAAENTQQAMDDMLALAMAPDEGTRQQVAQGIYDRRQSQARRAGFGRAVKYCVFALLGVLCVVVWQLGDPHSSLSAAARAFVNAPLPSAPSSAHAPAKAVRAPLYSDLIDLIDASAMCIDPTNPADAACRKARK